MRNEEFQSIRTLLVVFLLAALGTIGAVIALRHHSGIVNDAVWVRTVIVAADAVLLLAFAARAARGSRGAFRRLRIISVVTVVAIAVIVAVPGPFPLWLKIEQSAAGLVILGVAVASNRRSLRARFA